VRNRKAGGGGTVAAPPLVYHALLEVGPDGSTSAQVEELPGCFARAPARGAALEKLAKSLAAHLAWLRGAGEEAPARGQRLALEPAEEVRVGCDVREGDSEALFACDLTPASGEWMDRGLRLLDRSREALLASVEDLPDGALDAVDEARRRATFYGDAPCTIREVLTHIGKTEGWYATRLETPEAAARTLERLKLLASRTRDAFDLLDTMRTVAAGRLCRLGDPERARKLLHAGEAWTARKVLRRLAYHERLHGRSIMKIRKRLGL